MRIARTANPALNDRTFNTTYTVAGDEVMTLQGTVNKCFILIAIVMLSATMTWNQIFPDGVSQDAIPQLPSWFYGAWIGAIIGSLIVCLIIVFKQTTAPMLAPVYAVLEGVLMGTISALFEMRYPGIVFQAVLGTGAVFTSLLLVYKSGMIKVTDNFKLGVAAATGGVFLIYLFTFVMSFFTNSVPMIHQSGTLGIAFSLIVIGIASLNLVLDFDFIEKATEKRSPKYLEWYAAFGLLVTLIWLYIEILRLLSKLQSRD